jgi:Ala-tRNA(Pro) deacylase
VLLDSDDCHMVAMIPASGEVMLGKLRTDYGREFHLADEKTVREMFADCEPGVVPGMPAAWGMEMVWDDALLAQPDLYLEAGDHSRLIHIETRYLKDLIGDSPCCRFSQPLRRH